MKHITNFLTHAIVGLAGGVIGIAAGVVFVAAAVVDDPEGWNRDVVDRAVARYASRSET